MSAEALGRLQRFGTIYAPPLNVFIAGQTLASKKVSGAVGITVFFG